MRRTSRLVVSAVLLTTAALTTYLAAPAAEFQVASIRCGHQPVVAFKESGMWRRYLVPGDFSYGPRGVDDEYFCTTRDAEAAGYLPEAFLHA